MLNEACGFAGNGKRFSGNIARLLKPSYIFQACGMSDIRFLTCISAAVVFCIMLIFQNLDNYFWTIQPGEKTDADFH